METWLDAYAARAHDDHPAVVEPDCVLSSRDLTALASAADRWLDSIGAPVGRPVAALVSTTTEAFALTIAGAASGRPLAPLGTRLTSAELQRTLLTLEPGIVGAAPQACDLAHAAAGDSRLAVHRHPVFAPSDRPITLTAPADRPAAILHTSGTSGQPKPVPYPQGRLLLRTRVNAGIL